MTAQGSSAPSSTGINSYPVAGRKIEEVDPLEGHYESSDAAPKTLTLFDELGRAGVGTARNQSGEGDAGLGYGGGGYGGPAICGLDSDAPYEVFGFKHAVGPDYQVFPTGPEWNGFEHTPYMFVVRGESDR